MRFVIDIETLADYFCITFLDYDSESYFQFELSSRRNQIKEMIEFYQSVRTSITFNGCHFDNIVINYIVANPDITVSEIYKVAQALIGADFTPDEYRSFSYDKSKSIIDIFLFWSRGLRISKKLSLKGFASSMGMEVLEMPIEHTQNNLTESEMDLVLEYNLQDCLVTKELAFFLREKINLRKAISDKYGFDAMSMDEPKIASEILISSVYSDWRSKSEFRKKRYVAPLYVNGNYVPEITFKTDFFKSVDSSIRLAKNGFGATVIWKRFDGSHIKISYGSGGIHTVNSWEIYKSDDKIQVITSDVSSLYPQLLINHQFIRPELQNVLKIYSDIKDERIIAKKTGDKIKNEVLKLVLNSFTGLLDMEHSPFYSPQYIMGLRLTGQLLVSRLMEELNDAKFLVISANTDGIEVLMEKGREAEYDAIIDLVSKEFNVSFESEHYSSIYYQTVNDYIAFGNKIKTKSECTYDHVLDGSNEFRIVPFAMKEYFEKGIPFEKTITECTDLMMFTISKKVDRKYSVYYMGKKVQRLNRYIMSKKGGYLYKSTDGISMNAMLKGVGVYLVNDDIRAVNAKDYSINYQAYINKCNEKLNNYFPKQLVYFNDRRRNF